MTEAAVLVDQRRMPNAGEVLAGMYRLEQLLAVGGMGHIFIATNIPRNARVCLKILSPQCAGDDGAVRFFREAKAAAQLKSEYVVRILDVNRGDEATLPFIVMELLDGRDVRYRIKQGPVPVAEALQMGIQMCEALGEAHSFGIVHRDIKPANLVLVPSPKGGAMIKVLDFGISKMANETVDVTSTGTMMGSPAYMPPEQVRSGRNADARSDIWAVGVVLYELLTGKSPFQRDHVASTLLAVVADDPPPAHTVRAEIPPSLSDALVKCMRKRPQDRFNAIIELAMVLRSIAAGNAPVISLTQSQRVSGASSYPPSGGSFRTDVVMATTQITSTSTASVPRPQSKVGMIAAAAAALVVVVSVASASALYGAQQAGANGNTPETRPLTATSRTQASVGRVLLQPLASAVAVHEEEHVSKGGPAPIPRGNNRGGSAPATATNAAPVAANPNPSGGGGSSDLLGMGSRH